MTGQTSRRHNRWLDRVAILCLVAWVALLCVRTWREAPQQSPGRRNFARTTDIEHERSIGGKCPPEINPEHLSAITEVRLARRLVEGARWILRMQEPSGRFWYWYDPEQDLFSDAGDDNFLRQAGTCYALALAYEMTGERDFLTAAQRSLEYLRGFMHDLDDDKAYFLFDGMAKLGGIALPMLAMLKVRALTGQGQYDGDLKKLAAMVLHLQEQYGTGQYKSTYVYRGDFQHEKTAGWESNIYPGEAMLALAEMHRQFGEARHRDSIDLALSFYREESRWQNHAFLAWSISAMASMFEQTRLEPYAEFGLLLSDHMITEQNFDDDARFGSFHREPGANTSSYIEGLGDGLQLASLRMDQKRMDCYSTAILAGFVWLFQLQYDEEHAAGLPDPGCAVGGVRSSPGDAVLRIDATQHTISAYSKGLRYVFRRPRAQGPSSR